MTREELSQLYHLNKEVELYRKRLESEENNELKTMISNHLTRITAEKIRLERFIEAIPDSYTRQIFIMRFCMMLSWNQIALRLKNGRNTKDAVRQMCYRSIVKANKS